ncbi:MAG: MFS transporter [Betaproteobacteria bacterium]|nr:MFS transporter [Betaproteobacteria bacterium]
MTNADDHSPFIADKTGLTRGLMLLLAATGFAVGGAMHTHSPVLGAMAQDFGVDAAAIGWVATLTFAGYFAGLLFIVPIGDRVDKRGLILAQLSVLILDTVALATTTSLWVMIAGSFVVGACVCLTQNLVPIAVGMSRPGERGRVVGTILMAMFLGFLFNRLASGLIGAWLGWRWSFAFSALVLGMLAIAVFTRLPSVAPTTKVGYGSLLLSVWTLFRSSRSLRLTSATQLFLAIGYGGFWATLAPMLLLLHGMGPAEAGLMAIPGAAGVLISRSSGRWMDRSGAMPVVVTSIFIYIGSLVILGFSAWWIGAIIIGAAIMDCGIRGAIIANQTLVAGVDAEARNRSNTIFGAHNWGGNTVGAFLASMTLANWGWVPVCAIFVTGAFIALLLQWRLAKHAP